MDEQWIKIFQTLDEWYFEICMREAELMYKKKVRSPQISPSNDTQR